MPGSEVLDVPFGNKGNVKISVNTSVMVTLTRTCVLASIPKLVAQVGVCLATKVVSLGPGRAHEEGRLGLLCTQAVKMPNIVSFRAVIRTCAAFLGYKMRPSSIITTTTIVIIIIIIITIVIFYLLKASMVFYSSII